MKAKKVYEFRTSGEIVKMGNDVLIKKQWEQFLNKHLYRSDIDNIKYEIKNGKVYVYSDLELVNVENLPDYLIYIKDDFILEECPITEIKHKLKIEGNAIFSYSNLIEYPEIIDFGGDVILNGTQIPSIPDDLEIYGNFDLSGTQIIYMPNSLYVEGDLNLSDTEIKYLPQNLKIINGSLDISRTNIEELPRGLEVYNLDISFTNITELPDNLIVKETIYISSDMDIENINDYNYEFI